MNYSTLSPRAKSVLGALVALLAALGISVAVVVTNNNGPTPTTTTYTVGGPHGTPEQSVTVPSAVVDQAEAGLDTHQDLRSEQPEGVTPTELDAAAQQQEALAQSDQLPIVTPDAAPSQRGCVTHLVQNYSTRRGVAPRLFVLHYTVSPNRPGWSDVNAVVSLFDRASFQASSNYVIDNEGNCAYIVRESDKAWTQAAANPVSISVEVINSGSEPTYAASKGLQKIALVAHDAMARWHIPIQLGSVRGCTVTRPGLVDHLSLGTCGGGHHDISPYRIAPVLAAIQAIDKQAAAPSKPLVLPPVSAENAVCTVYRLNQRLGLPGSWKVSDKTRTAIKALQKRWGIPVTGQAGVRVGRILHLKGCNV